MELLALLGETSSLLRLVGPRITPDGVVLILESMVDHAHCPACGARSERIHSRCRRMVQDLPILGRKVNLELHLHRFFCDLPACSKQTFTQPLPQIALPHARRSTRLSRCLSEIAFSTGGEAGARLASVLGMPASGDTLLRLLRKSISPSPPASPRVLGVDDWALRRGQVYGTILCDLESHRPLDLLPERSAEVLAAWLRDHPGVQVISRDRGGDYARGASIGAPDALQVADRWHLLHNLTQALQEGIAAHAGLLERIAAEVTAAMTPAAPAPAGPDPPGPAPAPAAVSRADQKKQQSRQRRMARYQQVQEMRKAGISLRAIAQRLKMSRETVRRFAASGQFPERATPTPKSLPIDAFIDYLKRRWESGCDNSWQLWREIESEGYGGSVYTVCRQVRRWRLAAGRVPPRGQRPITSPRMIRSSPRRLAWLVLGHVREPTAQDQATLAALHRRWPQLQETAELCRQFAQVLHERDDSSLEAWMQLAQEEQILPEVRRFAEALRQDWAAVVEAVRQPWSQGQVEGQINRLKLIKRQMYGRAGFDLLRQRVLHARPA